MPPGPRPRSFDRVVVVVCDSLGCGLAPDAADFGDAGANTLARIIEHATPRLDHLKQLGLDRIPGVPEIVSSATVPTSLAGLTSAWGRMVETSAAKDTISGHWELMGLPSTTPFPVFPNGFPRHVVERLEEAFGRSTIGNSAASGTAIIDELGARHVATGAPIIYTSADSVLQIAAHEEVIPVADLYDMCRAARRLMEGPYCVARVIARPFVGDAAEGFRRTPRRRDFALEPDSPTVLDHLVDAGLRTLGIGKIYDIFSGRGLSDHVKTEDNADGVRQTHRALDEGAADFVFTNLVDFDSEFGHRRDIAGYARALEELDEALPDLLGALEENDLLMITADHGNDPGYDGTDHTRECVPLLAVSSRTPPADLGTRMTFADLGRTLLDNFNLGDKGAGTSFFEQIAGP